MSNSSEAAATVSDTSQTGGEVTLVRLAPYKETPEWYRTIVKVEGAKRWFEKSRVSVVSRDSAAIILSMPRIYADTRQGIASLIVKEQDAGEGGAPASAMPEAGETEGRRDAGLPERLFIQMGPAGRIVIPVVFRDAMQAKEGDRLMARVVDGELKLITPRMSVKLAQKLVRETIPGDDSLADALIEERRREFEREMADG